MAVDFSPLFHGFSTLGGGLEALGEARRRAEEREPLTSAQKSLLSQLAAEGTYDAGAPTIPASPGLYNPDAALRPSMLSADLGSFETPSPLAPQGAWQAPPTDEVPGRPASYTPPSPVDWSGVSRMDLSRILPFIQAKKTAEGYQTPEERFLYQAMRGTRQDAALDIQRQRLGLQARGQEAAEAYRGKRLEQADAALTERRSYHEKTLDMRRMELGLASRKADTAEQHLSWLIRRDKEGGQYKMTAGDQKAIRAAALKVQKFRSLSGVVSREIDAKNDDPETWNAYKQAEAEMDQALKALDVPVAPTSPSSSAPAQPASAPQVQRSAQGQAEAVGAPNAQGLQRFSDGKVRDAQGNVVGTWK